MLTSNYAWLGAGQTNYNFDCVKIFQNSSWSSVNCMIIKLLFSPWLTLIATGHKQEAHKNVIPIISRADTIFSSRLFVTCNSGELRSCRRFL